VVAASCYVCYKNEFNGPCAVGTFSNCGVATRLANNGEAGLSQLGPGTHEYGCTRYHITNAGDVISGPCEGSHDGYTLVGFDGTNCCSVKSTIHGEYEASGTTDNCGGAACQGGTGGT
jgi:hypothetical protein